MIKLCLICGFLLTAFLSNGQTGKLRLPDSLLAAGNTRMASIEYERVWLEASDGITRAKALLGKAEACKMMSDVAAAERTLYRIKHDGLGDSLSFHVRYQLALCAYLQGKFTQAQDVLDQMYFAIKDSVLTAPSLMIYALALNEERKWDEARAKVFRMISLAKVEMHVKDSLHYVADRLYDPVNYPKLKNVRTAKVISLIVPGSGQIYAGKPLQGIASILLQAAAVTFTVYSFNVGTYVTSVGAGASLFGRFYTGGARNAEKLTMKKNYERSRSYNERLREEIIFITNDCMFWR